MEIEKVGDKIEMKAFYMFSSRSDSVLINHLQEIEFVEYEDAEVVLCVGDRKEIHALTLRAFLDHKYIIHYYAGALSKHLATFDDYLRHCITLMSDEQWVENKKASRVVKKLCKSINKTPNIKIVGSNHLLDVITNKEIIIGNLRTNFCECIQVIKKLQEQNERLNKKPTKKT